MKKESKSLMSRTGLGEEMELTSSEAKSNKTEILKRSVVPACIVNFQEPTTYA